MSIFLWMVFSLKLNFFFEGFKTQFIVDFKSLLNMGLIWLFSMAC